ncbi:HpcH/HpaI aldolase family protein [Paenarthrobacter ureafaciens]|uniref:HpcH/HpaI aldolase family protein n=1 Tax=Paenarthrobacter ureafaciens TaxID=37931 RepID=UPI0034639E41
MDVVALAGYDFVVLDLEHSQISYAEAREVLQAARANGLSAIVRLPNLDAGLSNRLLEAGAEGIQVSSVDSSATATSIKRALSYPPVGDRSISLSQPAARYGTVPVGDYLDEFTHRPLSIGQLESVELRDDPAAIVPNLDVAFIGTLDLSVSAGTPGSVSRGRAAETITQVEAAAKQSGTTLGIFAGEVAEALGAVERGYRYIVVGSDLGLISAAATQAHDKLLSIQAAR